jgi:hypothetical protein
MATRVSQGKPGVSQRAQTRLMPVTVTAEPNSVTLSEIYASEIYASDGSGTFGEYQSRLTHRF